MGRSLILLLLRIVGIALVVFGVLWALQGLGLLPWPADSFMIGDPQWVRTGAVATISGFLALIFERKLRSQ